MKKEQLSAKTLISNRELRKTVHDLADQISQDFSGKPITLVGLLNGSIFFLVDLIRRLKIEDLKIECWKVSSYQGTKSTGKLKGLKECTADFKGRHVIIIDDIYDTGTTIHGVRERVLELGALSVKVCVLLVKKTQRKKTVKVHYVGLKIDDIFVAGYGLDYNGRFREAPSIRILSPKE